MKKIILAASVIFSFYACHAPQKKSAEYNATPSYQASIQKRIICENGSVVSGHPLASKVGVEILKEGGNAIDAAIATQLALAVVFPNAGNIGGGGFMVARLAGGSLLALDYREMAPQHAARDMYLDNKGDVYPDKSINGHLSAGIPGTIAGLFASAKYGKLSFEKLIQPAIDLAQKGFVLTEDEASSLNEIRDDLKKYNTIMPAFIKESQDGSGWKSGDTLIQTDLANTLKRIRDNGEKGFYEGETANLIVDEMKRGGGIISLDDLKSYKAKFRDPHVFKYKDYTVIGMPMPSSGGILLNQMMKMIEDKNIGTLGFESPASVQLMTEVERRAFADRAKYMGDADYFKVPEKMLVDDNYLHQRMKDFKPGIAGNSKQIQPGIMTQKESEETTHLDVIDKEGNAVAITTTLNNSYGSKTVVGKAGFFINDEMDDFSAKPGSPNLYGAVGGDANSIAPGKRMLSSMSPTIVLKMDKPFLVLGTPGGTTIPTSVFQTLVDILEFNMSTEDAVYKPKFHHQWLPDTLEVEKGFAENVRQSLQNMGYKIIERDGIGRTEVIKVLPGGKFESVADNRGEDDAEGY